ncbi:uncharacterized protein EMH_0049680 [Eimeria mitis]|uniref:Transmembrane protein n=1 Tax=Eimeria mitis TaxID=44415 RepID=U6JZA7_9EIME|nr:uncharacterized protein EMH_0049680 [Eimeria mitis]CDJ30784.1 hypothetical protein, conserved [Eimeria mitis]
MEDNISHVGKGGRVLDQESVQHQYAVYDPVFSAASSYGNVGADHQPLLTLPSEYGGGVLAPTPVGLKPRTQAQPPFTLFWPLLAFVLGLLAIASICSSARRHSAKLNFGVRRLASENKEEGEDSGAPEREKLTDLCLSVGEWAAESPLGRLSPTFVEDYFLNLDDETVFPPAGPPGTAHAQRQVVDSVHGDDEGPGPSSRIFGSSSGQPQKVSPAPTVQHDSPERPTFHELVPVSAVPESPAEAWVEDLDSPQPSGSEGVQSEAAEGPAPSTALWRPWSGESQVVTPATSSLGSSTLPQQHVTWPSLIAGRVADTANLPQAAPVFPPQQLLVPVVPAYIVQPLSGTASLYPQLVSVPHVTPQPAPTLPSGAVSPSDAASPSSSDTMQRGAEQKTGKGSSAPSSKLKDLLSRKRARRAAIRSVVRSAIGGRISSHPYIWVPPVTEKVEIKPSCMNSPELPPTPPQYLAAPLLRFRALCKKRHLVQRDVDRLLMIAGKLAKLAQERMTTVPKHSPGEAVDALGARFLLLHTLYSIKKTLGSRVRWDPWWREFTAIIPSDYCRPMPEMHRKLSRDLHALALRLSAAIMKFKVGEAPEEEEVVALKMRLFFSNTAFFRRPVWDPWRLDRQSSD